MYVCIYIYIIRPYSQYINIYYNRDIYNLISLNYTPVGHVHSVLVIMICVEHAYRTRVQHNV